MKTSCIRYPESNIYLQLHAWMFELCKGNQCAALLIAFFSGWHDWKLKHDSYYRRYNDIAETHGDGRPHIENAYLFFTIEELIEGIMGLYGKKAINEALDFLVAIGIISIHKNPNPRYYFDKTRYFIFYADVCNEWIAEHYPPKTKQNKKKPQPIDYKEEAKMPHGKGEKALPSSQNGPPSSESNPAITNTTNNTTNKTQSTRTREETTLRLEGNLAATKTIQPIITALMEKGMVSKRFYPEAINDIHHLVEVGATVEVFIEAYDLSLHATQGQGFGVPYLIKVVKGLIDKKQSAYGKDPPQIPKDRFSETVYESDIRNALNWMKGEDKCKQAEEES